MEEHTFPPDLIREILLRLPVRSLLCFKSVCKSWLSLISDPQFCIAHYDFAAAPSHRLLLRSVDFYAQSIDLETMFYEYYSLLFHFLHPPPSPPADRYVSYIHRCYSDLTTDPPEIMGSCRGLILLYYPKGKEFILWNPSISFYKRLPNSDKDDWMPSSFLYGLGYEASTDDYLVVLIADNEYVDTEIQVLSFRTELRNSYIINASYECVDNLFSAGVLVNGALHWLVISKDKEKKVHVIIAFHLKQRTLSEIPLFDPFIMTTYCVNGLRILGGYLSVCCSLCRKTEIWMMKEYGEQSSWTKFLVIPTYGFAPIWITKDGGIFGTHENRSLQKLNHKGDLIKHLTHGPSDHFYYCANLQSAVYRESLLSLGKQVKTTNSYRQENSGSIVIPMFNGKNYHNWAVKMKYFLRSQGLWDVVISELEPRPLRENPNVAQLKVYEDDKLKKDKAITFLHSALADHIFTKIMDLETPKQVWDKIYDEFEIKTKSIKHLMLKKEFELMKMKDNESVKDYSDILMDVINIASCSENLPFSNKGKVEGSSTSRKGWFLSCSHCQRTNHAEEDCWYKDKPLFLCNFCNKHGHSEKYCRAKKKSSDQPRK